MLYSNKLTMKAQGLSLSTVVIGVILLIVLAVVAFIFFRGTNSFSSGLNLCESCVVSASECGGASYPTKPIAVPQICATDFDSGNEKSGKFCCKATGG